MDMQCSQCRGTKLEDVSYMDAYFEGNIYMCLECSEFTFVKEGGSSMSIIILSGGAQGSDTVFGNITGTVCYHFSFEGHVSSYPLEGKVIKVPQEELNSREPELVEVFNKLNRPYSISNSFVRNLLLRNMYQVVNKQYKSELCIAVADVYRTSVSGGTNYAVTKAIIENIPILVLDKRSCKWYEYSYSLNKFVKLDRDIDLNIFKVITGIGSRDITYKLIKEVCESFKEKSISNKE